MEFLKEHWEIAYILLNTSVTFLVMFVDRLKRNKRQRGRFDVEFAMKRTWLFLSNWDIGMLGTLTILLTIVLIGAPIAIWFSYAEWKMEKTERT